MVEIKLNSYMYSYIQKIERNAASNQNDLGTKKIGVINYINSVKSTLNKKERKQYKLRMWYTRNGKKFWYTRDFWCKYGFLWKFRVPPKGYKQLEEYEWDGNEISFEKIKDNISKFQKSLYVLKYLVYQLSKQEGEFDVIYYVSDAYYDEGCDETADIRFYEVRNNYQHLPETRMLKIDAPLIFIKIKK